MRAPIFSCTPKATFSRSTFSRYQEKIKVGMTRKGIFILKKVFPGREIKGGTGNLDTYDYSPVRVQRSVFSHQLNERIH
jgi:hypothetical protein